MNAQLGDTIRVVFGIQDGDGAPVDPDTAPTLTVIPASGSNFGPYKMPPIFPREDGLFLYELFLGTNSFKPYEWTTGQKWVLIKYDINGARRAFVHSLLIKPGGDTEGAILSMGFFRKSQGDVLVLQTQSGTVVKRVNPRL